MYDIEKYDQAVDVADAIRALENDPDAVVISGGSDVLIKIREGKLAGCSLVSIHGIKELGGYFPGAGRHHRDRPLYHLFPYCQQ